MAASLSHVDTCRRFMLTTVSWHAGGIHARVALRDLQAALKEWQGRGWDVQGSVADLADPAAAAELMQNVKLAFGSKLHILGELKPAARRL